MNMKLKTFNEHLLTFDKAAYTAITTCMCLIAMYVHSDPHTATFSHWTHVHIGTALISSQEMK